MPTERLQERGNGSKNEDGVVFEEPGMTHRDAEGEVARAVAGPHEEVGPTLPGETRKRVSNSVNPRLLT